MVYINTWILFIRAILSYLLLPKSTGKYYLSGKKLFSLAFRYPDKSKNSFSFFMKSYVNAVFSGKLKMADVCHVYNEGNVFFYDNDSSSSNEKARISHIEYFLKKPINGSIWKDMLLGYFSFADKFLQVFFETLLFIFLLPAGLFARYRGSVGLIFTEYIELVNLLKVIKKQKVSVLYYYSIYEKDSNISSIALQNAGVKINKITSLTPIKFWNSIIVAADTLILCDMNQVEELNGFKSTIQVGEIKVWGPETIASSARHYLDGSKYNINKNIIGFYSTASYLRALQGEVDHKNMNNNENTVKVYLAEYLKSHAGIKLVVFPHPREKKDDVKNTVSEHYKSFFEGLNYSMYDSPLSSSQCFDAVDLGVAMYSSVIYERLYFGFKSLMMPFGEDGLELPGKALNYICAKDKAEFFSKIDMFLSLSVLEYFDKTGLKKSPFMEEALSKAKSK
ncbi:MAG TPA: hypothetical protein VN922_25250 [Bacteroidia bacterium]|nr:hypothetical protein [Bacteroidia bacterium]